MMNKLDPQAAERLRKIESHFLRQAKGGLLRSIIREKYPTSGYLICGFRESSDTASVVYLEYGEIGDYQFPGNDKPDRAMDAFFALMDEILPDQPLALICRYSAADKRWDDFVITGEDAAHYSNHFSNIDALADAFHPLQPDATKLPRPLPSSSDDRDKMRQLIERSER